MSVGLYLMLVGINLLGLAVLGVPEPPPEPSVMEVFQASGQITDMAGEPWLTIPTE